MPMSGGWHGIPELKAALHEHAAGADKAAKVTVVRGGALATKLAQANFQGHHRAGQPHVGGNQPNIVTGYLRRSIRMTPVIRLGFSSYMTRIGPNAIYARAVELGLHGHAGYPYFTPAAVEVRLKMPSIAFQSWEEFLRA